MDEERFIKQMFSLKGLTVLLFLCIFLWLIRFLYHFNIDYPQGYILGDWLVNYADGGFKRRGLTGSLFFIIQDLSGLSLQVMAFISQLLFYLVFFFFLLRILKHRKISLYYITLLLSPLTLMFYFNDVEALGKKEMLILALFAYFVFMLSENRFTKGREYIVWILLFLTALSHELVFFYTPWFIFTLLFFNKKPEYKRYAVYFLVTCVPVVLIYLLGNNIEAGQSIEILQNRGVVFDYYSKGIFTWPEGADAISHALAYYKYRAWPYVWYLLAFAAGFSHFFYFVYLNDKTNFKKYMLVFLILVAYSLPLFYLAIDWGRWLHAHFSLLLIICATLLPREQENAPIATTQKPGQKYLGLLLIPLMLIWVMPSYGTGFAIKSLDFSFRKPLIHVAEHQARNSPTPSILVNLSLHYYNEADYEKCIEVCRKAIKIKPDYAEAYNNICAAYNAMLDFENALEACNKALEINPAYGLAKANKAWAFQKSLKTPLNPGPEYFVNLSLEYYNMQLYEKSIEACNQAIVLKPDYALAYYNKCCAYIALSKWDEAISNCSKALELNPNMEAAAINLNWAMQKRNPQ